MPKYSDFNLVTFFKVSTSKDSHIMLCWHLENFVCDTVLSTLATWLFKIYTFSLYKTYSSLSQQTYLNLYKYQPKGPCFIKYTNHEWYLMLTFILKQIFSLAESEIIHFLLSK